MRRCFLAKKTKEKDPLEGLVLVPKPGKEAEFEEAFKQAAQIGHGALGWQGQAEMMVELGLDKELKLRGTKKARITQMRRHLQSIFLETIYKHGDWVTPEEADKRRKSLTTLFGKQDEDKV